MDVIVSSFKHKMRKFIMLNGEENLYLINRYISEKVYNNKDNDNEDNYIVGRSGTIDYLRKNSIPENKMLIWGAAGTGKSTTLEYLSYIDAKDWLNQKTNKIPVLIQLGLLINSDQTIFEFIQDKLSISKEQLDKLFRNGLINLFLDGINEIPYGNNLLSIRLKEIKTLISNYKKSFFIISNRPEDDNVFKDVPVFNLMRLSDSQMNEYIIKNAAVRSTEKIIMDAMAKNEHLRNIVRTPLMLSRLVDVVDVTGVIPDSEGEIIGIFLDSLLKREKNEKLETDFDIRKAKYVLRAIAYNGLEEYSTNSGISEEVILTYISKCMKTYCFKTDSFYMLDKLVQLDILAKKESLYLFSHQAYQDYYHSQEMIAVLGLEE